MGETRLTFKRYEKKYLLTREQYEKLFRALEDHIVPDQYFRSTVCSLYYDTDDYALIRHSIEAPVYKEKLRLRSYGPAAADSQVFLELKKKYDGVVYKRRIALTAQAAEDWSAGIAPLPEDSQIGREIDYFRAFYRDLQPALYLSYDRCAFFSAESRDLRVTFDRHIAWRREGLRLTAPAGGRELLEPGWSLLEIKAADAIPFWLVQTLSRYSVRQTSFSKYGEAYRTILAEQIQYKEAGNDE